MFGSSWDPYESSLSYEYPYHPSCNTKHIDEGEIDNLSEADYGWSPNAVPATVFGTTVQNPDTGPPMGDPFYNHILERAVGKAERALDNSIKHDTQHEMRDYHETEFNSYMFVHAYRRAILQVENLQLYFNGRPIDSYPVYWKKVEHLAGHVQLFPTAQLQTGQSMSDDAVFNGYPQLAGVYPPSGATLGPQMIQLEYVSGMLSRKKAGRNILRPISAALEQLVIKLSLIEIYQVWGNDDITLGVA
ncbi:putative tail fiber protein [Staphylococcus phage vB_SauH_DELF3]|nr:putative tail fiber protein [Staphylococcus phage vB_SauH_DELF3]